VRLSLSDRTVDAYVPATLRKLGVRTGQEAVAQAEARGQRSDLTEAGC